jgi:hypothetical protein
MLAEMYFVAAAENNGLLMLIGVGKDKLIPQDLVVWLLQVDWASLTLDMDYF